MSYPLIIFGAGASWDFSSLAPGTVSPLTKELVSDDRFMPPDLLGEFSQVRGLLNDVLLRVRIKEESFESVLTIKKQQSLKSPILQAQFVALEAYLKKLFRRISHIQYEGHFPGDRQLLARMHQVNNYASLLSRIETWCGGKGLVVTFNYDSLFEQNLPSGRPIKMSEYVSNNLMIFKLHGSHDWVYVEAKELLNRFEESAGEYMWLIQNPNYVETHHHQNWADPLHESEAAELADRNNYVLFPALAVPLKGKDRYICPKAHINILEKEMKKVDRVLVVGWRAEDEMLLATMKRNLPKSGYKLSIVSGSEDESYKVAKKVTDTLGTRVEECQRFVGFSNFLSDDASEKFFQE